ncbi:MAG: NYN domain-containing protein [Hornefia sp.]|nr:NYN domain-containing protein [Hornefia sp.]
MADEKRIALLIDAENISAQYADYIIGEVDNYGICSYKRIYGSWDRIVKTKWEGEIRKNSLKAMMQINNTKGKNSTDSALIIDAMDILYRGNVDGFCIVSSDSDFTSLARRLMESGLMVIGMGESDKATEALENAYDKFVYIDLLAKQVQEEAAAEEKQKKSGSKGAAGIVAGSQGSICTSQGMFQMDEEHTDRKEKAGANTPSKKAVEQKIHEIIMENDDRSKPTDLGQIGNELSRTFKNFDVRYYTKRGGKRYKFLKEFVSDYKSLEITVAKDNRVYVSIK